ncbi:T9SS type A sorting domain-containing protein [Hymenobacter terrenus]|uniref:T9SS type A sorting domain-containing protein n=1 Tax=Hymenobacter terrenus TaxID=1629124 RepID=UPI0006191FC9|nr:T9SS type A sorting domain-containing protein [Hymenobacter terrenus]
MKKNLLFLGLLGFANQVQAQGPWTQVNNPSPNIFGPYTIERIHTLSPTLMWGVASDRVPAGAPASIPGYFIVTNNPTGAGDQFDFGAVTVSNDGAAPTSHNATVANISGISATTAVAAAYPGSTYVTGPAATAYGGEIVKTTNAGNSWVKKTTATQFRGEGAFCNWVHMFTPLIGVALGDPTTAAPNQFEILRTTDGGETWNRLTTGVPPAIANEYGNAEAFFALDSTPGTLWAGLASSDQTAQVRVIKTTDFGVTWTVSNLIPNMVGAVTRLAFKNANEGICYGYTITGGTPGTITGLNVARTTDGGINWTPITPVNNASGSFFRNDIDAVNGVYYSVGPRYPVPTTGQVPEDFGTSTSTDGVNWTNLTVSTTTAATPGYFFTLDLIPGATANSTVGYGTLFTDINGVGGIFKYSRTLTANRNAALQSTLSVSPNPSSSGVFKVNLGSDLKAGAQLTVIDVVGRQVRSQLLNAAAIGAKTFNLDLGGEKTGVYTLRIRTDAGIATQKVVID